MHHLIKLLYVDRQKCYIFFTRWSLVLRKKKAIVCNFIDTPVRNKKHKATYFNKNKSKYTYVRPNIINLSALQPFSTRYSCSHRKASEISLDFTLMTQYLKETREYIYNDNEYSISTLSIQNL